MPLRRPISPQADFVDDFDLLMGVRFAMFDREKRVVCRVSYEALDEASTGSKETPHETFIRCRDSIEKIASARYDDCEEAPIVTSLNPG
jgi:Protein of unknown function (DUF1488)